MELENRYTNAKRKYDNNKKQLGKSTASKVLNHIGNRILKPAITNSSEAFIEDLLKKTGFSTNDKINSEYRKKLGLYDYYTKQNNKKNKSNNRNNRNNRNNYNKKKKRY